MAKIKCITKEIESKARRMGLLEAKKQIASEFGVNLSTIYRNSEPGTMFIITDKKQKFLVKKVKK